MSHHQKRKADEISVSSGGTPPTDYATFDVLTTEILQSIIDYTNTYYHTHIPKSINHLQLIESLETYWSDVQQQQPANATTVLQLMHDTQYALQLQQEIQAEVKQSWDDRMDKPSLIGLQLSLFERQLLYNNSMLHIAYIWLRKKGTLFVYQSKYNANDREEFQVHDPQRVSDSSTFKGISIYSKEICVFTFDEATKSWLKEGVNDGYIDFSHFLQTWMDRLSWSQYVVLQQQENNGFIHETNFYESVIDKVEMKNNGQVDHIKIACFNYSTPIEIRQILHDDNNNYNHLTTLLLFGPGWNVYASDLDCSSAQSRLIITPVTVILWYRLYNLKRVEDIEKVTGVIRNELANKFPQELINCVSDYI